MVLKLVLDQDNVETGEGRGGDDRGRTSDAINQRHEHRDRLNEQYYHKG